MSNPALNDKVFNKEIQASRQGGGFSPAWGSPADELPPNVFGAPDAAAGTVPPTGHGGPVVTGGNTMRVGGVTSASFVLIAILLVAAYFGWQSVELGPKVMQLDGTIQQDFSIPPWIWMSTIGAFVLAIVTIFKPAIARVTGPIYAVGQGLFVGAISAAYNTQFDGIVLQAVLLTVAVFLIMLTLFATGTIRVTEKLRMCIVVSTIAIAAVYLVTWVLTLFSSSIPMIYDAGPIGIAFSLLVVGIASFNLLLDFDFVQRGVAAGAPRYMEWFAAFGLLITLVWLYLEILRLLAKLRSN